MVDLQSKSGLTCCAPTLQLSLPSINFHLFVPRFLILLQISLHPERKVVFLDVFVRLKKKEKKREVESWRLTHFRSGFCYGV